MNQGFTIENDKFIIHDFQNKPTFASFLPGIAGIEGIPMWGFYVNRGQGIASFGSKDKNNAIMEFYPANKSYQNVETKGFRTFIKIAGEVYEPFRTLNKDITSKMIISTDYFEIVEKNTALGLMTKVKYFILPNENFGALIRKVEIKNLSNQEKTIEVIDGMPIVVPYGVENAALKEVSQTITAWMKVYNFENKLPFYKLSASASDEAKVEMMESGNFYCAVSEQLLDPIVDPSLIFGSDTSLNNPKAFINNSLLGYEGYQKLENQFPSAMTCAAKTLQKDDKLSINSIFGHVKNIDDLNDIQTKVLDKDFFEMKATESQQIHQYYTDHALTISGDERLNGYTKQTFLDNVLRGGFPIMVGDEAPKPYHVFSRKHGDLERDYNEFSLETNYYSQGNGNYRDVNQNRRSDMFFNPKIKKHNIKTFFDLIQLNGYNPLVIEGQEFVVKNKEDLEFIGNQIENKADNILELIKEPFTIGELSFLIQDAVVDPAIFNLIIDRSEIIINSEYEEGYWVDHWTYNLDLIENYLAIYPEQLESLLLEKDYTFYDDCIKVLPRIQKHVLTDRGVRQYEALYEDSVKKELINSRANHKNCVRDDYGNGDIYYTNLTIKIFTLILNKIATLDPEGIGIEMEADKPGWYDALNGLPGLLGSSFGETAELLRWVRFIKDALKKTNIEKIKLPLEIYEFYQNMAKLIKTWQKDQDNFNYWDHSTKIKEAYRHKVFNGLKGSKKSIEINEIIAFYEMIENKLEYSTTQALQDNGIYSMFYSYEAIDYDKTGRESKDGLPFVKVNAFKKHELSNFLEGQVKTFKVLKDEKDIKQLHNNTLKTDLYDEKLKMFRVNGHLDNENYEIGRAKAFSPGWLENGSIWLHMEYKYILELLKNNLYEEFYEVFENAGILYQDPKRYKRSIFENSSFILSSLNSDVENHGRGYIARLSGATAEYLQMWTIMAFGDQPFQYSEDNLIFKPRPVLQGKMFTTEEHTIDLQVSETEQKTLSLAKDTFTVRFLGHTIVTYHNTDRKDTFGDHCTTIDHYYLQYNDGSTATVEGAVVVGTLAEDLRKGEIEKVDIYLK